MKYKTNYSKLNNMYTINLDFKPGYLKVVSNKKCPKQSKSEELVENFGVFSLKAAVRSCRDCNSNNNNMYLEGI